MGAMGALGGVGRPGSDPTPSLCPLFLIDYFLTFDWLDFFLDRIDIDAAAWSLGY